MREIKFRAFDKDQRIMSAGFPLSWLITGEPEDMQFPATGESLPLKDFRHYFDEYAIMQFTGLVDKNGKEIYEGDILEYEYNRDTQTKALFTEEVKWDQWGDAIGFDIHTIMSYRIIGNIHEHPHLLNPKD